MKSSTATAWTSPKSNSRTPRRSNKGKTGSKRIGPATRTSTTIGKSDTIGFWNRWNRSQQFGQLERASADARGGHGGVQGRLGCAIVGSVQERWEGAERGQKPDIQLLGGSFWFCTHKKAHGILPTFGG